MKVSEAIKPDDELARVLGQLLRLKRHTKAWIENRESVAWIIKGFEIEDWSMAKEAWEELNNETKDALYLSRSNGGLWKPKEYQNFHVNEFFHGLDDG